MKPLAITILFDTDGPPPADQGYADRIASDDHAPFSVARALQSLGHRVSMLGYYDQLETIVAGLRERKPDLVFNLSEGFGVRTNAGGHVTALLEMLELPYTGSDPLALGISTDKGQSKKVLAYHGLRVPDFQVIRRGTRWERPSTMRPPFIVKPLNEDGSYAIAQTSVAENDQALQERMSYLHEKAGRDAIVEELIEGRELYLAVLGNTEAARALPVVEMQFTKMENENLKIATWTAKWDPAYRKRHGIRNVLAKNLAEDATRNLADVATTAYRALHLRDYGRIDVRLAPDGEVFVLEVNPNPYIAEHEDFPDAAESAGIAYPQLIQTIVDEAMGRAKHR